MPRDYTIRRICRLNELTTFPLAISDKWVDSAEFNANTKRHTRPPRVWQPGCRRNRGERDHLPQVPAASPFQRVGVRAGGYRGRGSCKWLAASCRTTGTDVLAFHRQDLCSLTTETSGRRRTRPNGCPSESWHEGSASGALRAASRREYCLRPSRLCTHLCRGQNREGHPSNFIRPCSFGPPGPWWACSTLSVS